MRALGSSSGSHLPPPAASPPKYREISAVTLEIDCGDGRVRAAIAHLAQLASVARRV
jgi:hypothetical protein